MISLWLLAIALFFSLHQVSVRKGAVSKYTKILIGTFVSILTTTLIFGSISAFLFLQLVISHNLSVLSHSHILGFIELMVIAGILHFFLARTLFYMCIDRLGANVAATLATTRVFFAAFLGIIFLNEFPKVKTVIMAIFVFMGVAILTFRVVEDTIGIFLGISTGFISALSSVIIKEGMFESIPILKTNLAVYGTFMGYLSALLVFIVSAHFLVYLDKQFVNLKITKIKLDFKLDLNYDYLPFVVGGVFVGVGHFLRYLALANYNVCTVETFLSMYPIFTYALSGLFLKNFEVFNKKFFIAAFLVIVGVEMYFIL